MSKNARLEQLELLLKANPNGLHRSEIGRRLGVHRSTAGRYIMELGEKTMLWEKNYRIGINECRSNPNISFSLPEIFSLQMAIQAFNKQLDQRHTHLVSATRKLALAIKLQNPVTSEKMFIVAEEMDHFTYKGNRNITSDFEQLAVAIEREKNLDFIFTSGQYKYKSRIVPDEFFIDPSVPLSKALRISGECTLTKKKCSLFLHDIEILKGKYTYKELSYCPFTKKETDNNIHLKLKIFNQNIMDSFSSITNHSFQIEELTDGTSIVRILVSSRNGLKKKLLQMGADIEVLYPEDIRKCIQKEIESIAVKYINSSEKEYIEGDENSFTAIRIREIHHRIKNQLALLTSLIDLYRNRSSSDSHISILDEVKSKITVISMVHDMLTTENFMTVLPVDEFIKKVCVNMIDSMETVKKIDFNIDITEIYLTENQITIIGLIMAELCINSLRHAFTNRNNGKISVSLIEENEVKTLRFKDNGKGLGINPDSNLKKGTGHNLVNIFVEQLHGKIEYISEQGTEVVITFI